MNSCLTALGSWKPGRQQSRRRATYSLSDSEVLISCPPNVMHSYWIPSAFSLQLFSLCLWTHLPPLLLLLLCPTVCIVLVSLLVNSSGGGRWWPVPRLVWFESLVYDGSLVLHLMPFLTQPSSFYLSLCNSSGWVKLEQRYNLEKEKIGFNNKKGSLY